MPRQVADNGTHGAIAAAPSNRQPRRLQPMKKPPLALLLVSVAYLGYLAILLVLDFAPVVAGRLVLSAILIFFVLRGSRIAGNIFAVLCGLSALVLLVAAVAIFSTNTKSAVIFVLVAGLLATFAGYLFFNTAVRAFQSKLPPLPAGPEKP